MNVTIAYRPHLQVHRLPAIAFLAIAATAALVLVLSMQPSTAPPATVHAEAIGATGASVRTFDAPKNRSPVFLDHFRDHPGAAASPKALAPSRKSARTPWVAGGVDTRAGL
jgi:hypothetical protein